jgi:hypothetical protein
MDKLVIAAIVATPVYTPTALAFKHAAAVAKYKATAKR